MGNFLKQLFGVEQKSASRAKDRLQMVLIHDRTNLSAATLEDLKNDLIDTISRHISIDPTTVTIEINQDGREQRLIADIPIKNSRSKR
jgi:cell division topological specificity factor